MEARVLAISEFPGKQELRIFTDKFGETSIPLSQDQLWALWYQLTLIIDHGYRLTPRDE